MQDSTAELLALAIFVVALCKSVWDLIISPLLFRHCSKGATGADLTKTVADKRKRDTRTEKAAFVVLTICSGIILYIGLINRDVNPSDVDKLILRIEKIERQLGSN